jgi:ribosomal protein S12 methylthiotransferase
VQCVSRPPRTVSIVTLGCARNEIDSEELAGRLSRGGWELTDADADVVLVNTCGFIDAAKKDSIDTVLAARDGAQHVVAVGCLAERYGAELADALPEADAVLGFDSYPDIAARLDDVAAGRSIAPHTPRDRRGLLPLAPAHRPAAAAAQSPLPGHAWLPGGGGVRTRLDDGPLGYLKIASGCDRRCTFCAIPSFRGAFVSRPPAELVAEARWLSAQGVREVVLVSENSTSYGKDMGDLRALEGLLPQLAALDGIERVRVSYLQPAELRPSLLEAIATLPGLAPYFDLSFQHASPTVLRRMKRFGSTESFLDLLARVRELAPQAGARSNVIVGFPGETDHDVEELAGFLALARLDAVGVFGYSDEQGTAAAGFDGKLDAAEVAARVRYVSDLAEELMSQRAEERIGTQVDVLVEESDESGRAVGRAAHQGPDIDGTTVLTGTGAARGALVPALVEASDGVDLSAAVCGASR